MVLQIKDQGFPRVLSKLGVQSPLSGPFWGFESTVIPTFELGSNSIQSVTGLINPAANHDDAAAVNPGASAIILQSPNLPAGLYGVQLTWTFGSGSVNASAILFKIADSIGTVLRTFALDTIGQAGSSRDFGRGDLNLVENISEQGLIFVENLTALASATVRCSMKWVRVGDNVFSF